MSEAPIKRGTARRLGLDLPTPYLTMRLEFDLGALGRRIAAMRAVPPPHRLGRHIDRCSPSRAAGQSASSGGGLMPEDVWHEKKESSFWSGTQTMWCGVTADSNVVTSSWWRSVTCSGCKAAMAAAKVGKK